MTAHVLVVEHEAKAGAGLIGQRIKARSLQMTVSGPDTCRAVPRTAQGYDGVVVLGGSMGPTDDHVAPWLPDTRALIRDCVDAGTPLLAVCLGAQLAATALGGVVEPLTHPEVGTGNIQLTDHGSRDPLLSEVPTNAPALHWHWLHVAQLPPGATVLASSHATAVQAFRVGVKAWAFQFHLEAVHSTARDWASEMTDDLRAIGLDPNETAAAWEAKAPEAQRVWADVIDRWLNMVGHP